MQADQTLQVFRLVSHYLPLNESLNLLCLNTYFYEHLPNSLFKRIIVQQALPRLFGNDQHSESLDQILSSLDLTGRSYDSIYKSLLSAKNLVKNPYGARGFENWSRRDGGDGWAIENWGTYRCRSHVFVSSYYWGELHQRIQLPEIKNRLLLAKSMIARRWDCGAKGQIVVEFDNSTQLSSDIMTCPYDERDIGNIQHGWIAISVKCKVPDEVKSVNLILRGSDTQFWAGNYGARFGTTSLRVYSMDDKEHSTNSIRKFKAINKQAEMPQGSIRKFKRIIINQVLSLIFSDDEDQSSIELNSLNLLSRSYDSLYESIKFASNLIKNPYGARGFSHWTVHEKGKSWEIDHFGTYKSNSSVFVSSYTWGELTQNILLPNISDRILFAKSMISRICNYTAKGQIVVEFDNGEIVRSEEGVCDCYKDEWVAIVLICRVPEEVKSARIRLIGANVWRENYGVKYGMNWVRVFKATENNDGFMQRVRGRVRNKVRDCCNIM